MRARPRIMWALGYLVVFLLLLFLVFLAINALSGPVRFVVAALLIVTAALALLMLLALLFLPAPDGDREDLIHTHVEEPSGESLFTSSSECPPQSGLLSVMIVS